MDGSRLLQELNLAARQPRRTPDHVIQATSSEGLPQGPYVVARVGFKPKAPNASTQPPRPIHLLVSIMYKT